MELRLKLVNYGRCRKIASLQIALYVLLSPGVPSLSP